MQAVTYDPLIDPSLVQRIDTLPAGSTVNDLTTFMAGHQRTHLGAKSNSATAPVEYFDGQMAEVLIYNNTLSGHQVRQVEAYLNLKYGFVQAPSVAPGLALHSSFNAATPSSPEVLTQDVSGNGHHAVNENASVIDDSASDPARDSAIDYGGNASLQSRFGNVLAPGTGDFSVSMWLNANAASGFDFVASHGNRGSSDGGWAVHLNNNTINIRGDFVGDAGDNRWDVQGATLTPGTWQHFTMVVDRGFTGGGSGAGGIVRSYLDGFEYGTAPLNSTATIHSNGQDLLLGMRNDNDTNFSYDGLLDEVRIYQGTALTPTQVQDLATNVDVPGASAQYDFSLNAPEVLRPASVLDDFDGYDGTIVGSVPSASAADTLIGAAAIDLPGSDAHYVSYGDVLNPGTDSYTVSLWFKPETTAGTHFVAGKGNAGSSSDGWSIWHDGTNLFIRADYNESNNGSNRLGVAQLGALEADQWHHVAMVIDQSTGHIVGYLNGLGSGASGTDNGWVVGGGSGAQTHVFAGPVTFNVGDPLLLGRRSSAGAPFAGQIDDFAIWTEALSAEQIAGIYQTGLLGVPVPEPGAFVLTLAGALMLLVRPRRRTER